jgi:NAD(P)-dependent dehydrogenase (short-subunit alcohol dehydrogenase family)
MTGLRGKVVLVTGALGGIGQAVCRALREDGALVAAADLRAPGPQAGRGDRQDGLLHLSGNLETDSARLVEETCDRFGRIDALVNLVGTNTFRDLWDLSLEEWNQVLRTNLTAAFMISTSVARALKRQGEGGSIVHFSSTTSKFGSPGQAAYAAAKAALNSLVSSMAIEWSPYSIRVNAIAPIMTRTAINSAWLDEEPDREARIAAQIPLGRLGAPADYAGMVRLMVSDELSFMTGQTVSIDGGAAAVHPLLGPRGAA